MDSVHSDMHHMRRDGGVEEKKDDDNYLLDDQQQQNGADNKGSPHLAANESIEHNNTNADGCSRGGNFQEQLQYIARKVLGSCGTAIEAVTFFVQDCRWPSHHQYTSDDQGYMETGHNNNDDPLHRPHHHQQQHHYARTPAPPLSIAQELQKLAAQAPRPSVRSTDIPKFLGEEAVYPFEDDNISCLSQHTLEEMAVKGGLQHHSYRQHHPSTVSYNDNGIHRSMGAADMPNPGQVNSRRRRGVRASMMLNHSQSSASRTSLEEDFT